jgi:O-antigen/teichoic acid export membrane protein
MKLEAGHPDIRSVALRMFRYALATIGPVGAAATQFILSLQLLHLLAPASFGSFSFLLVISQFSTGLWSALLCAPLPVVLAQEQGRDLIGSLFVVNLVLSFLAFGAFWLLGLGLGVPVAAAALFAAVGLLRWFARAHAYATGAANRTLASDLVYSVALLIGIGLVAILGADSPNLPYGALLVSAALSLLPFGQQYFLAQFVRLRLRELPRYAHVWREHSRWSLVGVVTTEATVNAHAYIVTLVGGPLAFAPIAASALIIRPISVVMNALSEFERPQMARQIARRDIDSAQRSTGTFLFVLALTWASTAAGAVLLMAYDPGVIFPSDYSHSSLALGMALWLAVTLMRILRTPDGVLLQAAGMFRWLAHASIISSVVSISAVAALLVLGGPLWSLGGILLGEAICAVWIWRQSWRWRATFRANPVLTGNEVQS